MSHPFEAPNDRYRVPWDGSFRVATAPTTPEADAPDLEHCKKKLEQLTKELEQHQRRLYADNRHSLLLVFQALDAAGKDGTIRAVLSGVNPAGCQVFSFKAPSVEELDHDFLWRTARRLPERGRIGVFNRSYYEEVLVVRVHPSFLDAQRLPGGSETPRLWTERFESIRDHEKHLARNGTVVLKFWLNISHAEQKRRFLARIDEPNKNWKFEDGDIRERAHWDAYMTAYEEMLNETSRSWAPWYAIPADDKPYMRYRVARTIVKALDKLDLRFPEVDDARRARLEEQRRKLEAEV